MSIKLLEEIEKKEALKKYGADAEGSGKNLPFASLSDDLKKKEEEKLWGGRNLYELYLEAQTPLEWHKELFDHARELGMQAFSSAFDFSAVDLLESLN